MYVCMYVKGFKGVSTFGVTRKSETSKPTLYC